MSWGSARCTSGSPLIPLSLSSELRPTTAVMRWLELGTVMLRTGGAIRAVRAPLPHLVRNFRATCCLNPATSLSGSLDLSCPVCVSGKPRVFLCLLQHPGLCRCCRDCVCEGAQAYCLASVLLEIFDAFCGVNQPHKCSPRFYENVRVLRLKNS